MHKNNTTFLSRVFGINSRNIDVHNPLFADDSVIPLYDQNQSAYYDNAYSDYSSDEEDSKPRTNRQTDSNLHMTDHSGDGNDPFNQMDNSSRFSNSSSFHYNNTDQEDDNPELLLLQDEDSSSNRKNLDHSDFQSFAKKTFNQIPKIKFQLPKKEDYPTSHRQPPDIENQNGTLKSSVKKQIHFLDPMDKALWMWSNVSNLDTFLHQVYDYYTGNGFNCIMMNKFTELFTVVFIVWLFSFMGNCIDYDKLMNDRNVYQFSQVKIDKCYSKIGFFPQKLIYWLFFIGLCLKLYQIFLDYLVLKDMKLFFNLLLGLSDDELQTISWGLVVKRIMILRDKNINAIVSQNTDLTSRKRMNAHDIANRILRKENYMIAMYNKSILDLDIELPLIGKVQLLTNTLQWNLNIAIFDYFFDSETGQINLPALKERNRHTISTELKKRLIFCGIINIVLAPILSIYFIMYYFLKFFYDFKTNPADISSREYSPYARWKLREFNELPHIFNRRLNISTESSNKYINQFPKETTTALLKFIMFISGSIVGVLVIVTILDPEFFLNFELTPGRTVLFYVSTLGAIFTICKNSIPDDTLVFDPEVSLRYLSQFTHYLPQEWEGKYHTEEVKNDFCKLYTLKLYLVGKEILSWLFLPYILCYKLPECADTISDFFREFSVHVDGLGYVCTFAMFQFNNQHNENGNANGHQNGNGNGGVSSAKSKSKKVPNPNRFTTKPSMRDMENDDKMIKSYMYFLESYGNDEIVQHQQALNRSLIYSTEISPTSGADLNDSNILGLRQRNVATTGKRQNSIGNGLIYNGQNKRLSIGEAKTNVYSNPIASTVLDKDLQYKLANSYILNGMPGLNEVNQPADRKNERKYSNDSPGVMKLVDKISQQHKA
ncbi:autophagy protein atg9 [Komagataella kurtzmanii]|nr:autophagy protein atg9 [Komagataella kurtzmanii]